jgi:hypothetical protein
MMLTRHLLRARRAPRALNCPLDRRWIQIQFGKQWVAFNKSEDIAFLHGIDEFLTLMGRLPQDS